MKEKSAFFHEKFTESACFHGNGPFSPIFRGLFRDFSMFFRRTALNVDFSEKPFCLFFPLFPLLPLLSVRKAVLAFNFLRLPFLSGSKPLRLSQPFLFGRLLFRPGLRTLFGGLCRPFCLPQASCFSLSRFLLAMQSISFQIRPGQADASGPHSPFSDSSGAGMEVCAEAKSGNFTQSDKKARYLPAKRKSV